MKRGFTLIEVLVTMTIVAILAGMMVPAVWKVWEGQDIQTTKERLNALKLAMVGDKSLTQSGIRTSYGFVGDNGELPFANSSSSASFSYLVNRPAANYPHWNGPYMSGVDTSTYAVDAWGRAFQYTLYDSYDGYANRHLSGEIRSAGPDGSFVSSADDIVVTLSDKEVAPSYRMQGTVAFGNLTGAYRVGIVVKFKDRYAAGGEFTSNERCTSTFPNYTTIVRDGVDPIRLPIGKATIMTRLFKGFNCSTPAINSATIDYFVSDNLSLLPVNLPVAFAP